MRILAACLLAALPLCAAFAETGKATTAGGSAYSLYEGVVKFSAPPNWPAIMQKTEGTPQFIAFLIKNPGDQGGGESAQVSVEAKLINDASTFPALVNAATDKAKQAQGYEARNDAGVANALHYVALDGKQRYEYREAWYLDLKIMIHVRCARPLAASANAEWTASYEAGCAQVLRTAKPH
jgi:hypothetical protein